MQTASEPPLATTAAGSGPAAPGPRWAELSETGYLIVPSAIGPARVAEVRAFLDARFRERFADEDLLRGDIIPDHLCQFPELVDTLVNEPIIGALKSLVGEGFVLLADSAIRNSYWRLHSDITTAEGAGARFHLRPDFHALTVGTYLQDCDEQGGGLFVVPGSHRRRDPLVERRRLAAGVGVPALARISRRLSGGRWPRYEDYTPFERGGRDLPTRAGDALIFDMRLLHRGSRATAPRTRTKFALFHHLSAPGPSCDEHVEFLRSADGRPYLHERRNLEPLRRAAAAAGFSVI